MRHGDLLILPVSNQGFLCFPVSPKQAMTPLPCGALELPKT